MIIQLLLVCPVHCYAREDNAGLQTDWEVLKEQIVYFSEKNTDSLYKYLLLAADIGNTQDVNIRQKLFIADSFRRYYTDTNQADSALETSRKAWQLALQTGDKETIYRQSYHLGNALNNMFLADSAVAYLGEAIHYFRETHDSIFLAKALSSEATALLTIGDNKLALERLYEASEILEGTDLYFELGKIYDNIGMINALLGYEEKTIEYSNIAIDYYRQLDDPFYLAEAYANIGVSWKNIEQYDTAMYYYRESSRIAQQAGYQGIVAKNMLNMGNLADVLGDSEQAKKHYLASLEICREEDILLGEYYNSINLGEAAIWEEQHDSAAYYLGMAVELGETHHFDHLDIAYYNLHYALAEAGRYREALEYLRSHKEYQDSVSEAQQHQEIMELQTRFETQKKEAQILELNTQRQQDKLFRAYLFLGIGGLIVAGLLVFIWIWRKHVLSKQQALQLEKDNQKKHAQMEKLRLEKKLEHEEAERYRLDLRVKEQELVCQTLKQAGVAHLNKKVKDELSPFAYRLSLKKDQELFNKRLQEITREAEKEPLADFEEIFKQMHSHFYEKLLNISPKLTQNDLQMAALLRMNISSKEIAALMNLAVETIDRRRHTIRKKLNLSSDQNLVSFLISI